MTPKRLVCLREDIARLNRLLIHGCGNAGCVISKPTGLHTNGACRCNPKRIAGLLLEMAAEIESLNQDWTEKYENPHR